MIRQRQRGISLVEILVALAVSAILLAGVVQLFLSTKQTYNTMEGLARLQEDGRFGLEFIARDIRSAGYYGCSGRQLAIQNAMNDGGTTAENFFRFQIDQPIRGYQATAGAASWTPDPTTAGAVAGAPALAGGVFSSDVLAIRLPLGDPLPLDAAVATGAATMTLDVDGLTDVDCPAWLPDAGETVVIADCEGGHALQVQSAPGRGAVCPGAATWALGVGATGTDPGNAATVNRAYNVARTEVMTFATRVYFVDDCDGDGVPGLCRRTLLDRATGFEEIELVPGVETMQVRYGVDTGDDGFANAYLNADDVNDPDGDGADDDNLWNEVVALRLALLVRTPDPVLGGAQARQHCLLGDPLSACAGGEAADGDGDDWTDTNDAFLRKVYTSTIVFRNRTPVQP